MRWNELVETLTCKLLEYTQVINGPQSVLELLGTLKERDEIRKAVRMYIDNVSSSSKCAKSNIKSKSYREEGNSFYAQDDFDGSIMYYTKSILFAECNSLELALSYGNRSAVLYHYEEWEACLEDIKRAMDNGYPKEKQLKLQKRVASCWLHLKNYSKAKEALQSIEQVKNFSESDHSDLDMLRSKIEALPLIPAEAEEAEAANSFPTESFVNKVRVKGQGAGHRSMVCSEDIELGNSLLLEEAYATVNLALCLEQSECICEQCCMTCVNPVPCHSCADILFCSDKCRLISWDSYHRWECTGTQHGLWRDLGISHLATRIIMQYAGSLDKALAEIKTPDDHTTHYTAFHIMKLLHEMKFGFEFLRNFGQKTLLIISLMTNMDNLDRADLMKYCVTAIMVMDFLKSHTNFLANAANSNKGIVMDVEQWDILFTYLIVHHICQLICNAQSIMRYMDTDRDNSYFYQIATGLFPVASSMNHSCEPNIVTSFHGRYQAVKAKDCIKKGQEILNCYGPHYLRMGYEERQRQLLTQYHFKCLCTACRDPNKRDMFETLSALKCNRCQGPIKVVNKEVRCQCSNLVDVDKIWNTLKACQAQMDNFADLIGAKTVGEAREMAYDILNTFEMCLHKHNSRLTAVYGWASAMLGGLGLYNESIDVMSKALSQTAKCWGVNSLEMADSFCTYSILLLKYLEHLKTTRQNRGLYNIYCRDAKKIMTNAKQIYSLYVIEETFTHVKLDEQIESIKEIALETSAVA